jgi:hypothetical protein
MSHWDSGALAWSSFSACLSSLIILLPNAACAIWQSKIRAGKRLKDNP